MKAVLITDVFQSLLMFGAIFSVIICAAIRAGGLAPIWETAVEGGRINFWKYVIIVDLLYRDLFSLLQNFGNYSIYVALIRIQQRDTLGSR